MATLEPSSKFHLTFELVYVMYSRTEADLGFRCVPLSVLFKRSALRNLRPRINAVKYRMDIDQQGFWNPKWRGAQTVIPRVPLARRQARGGSKKRAKLDLEEEEEEEIEGGGC